MSNKSPLSLGPLVLDLQGIELQQDELEIIQHPQVGGIILFSRNYESSEQLLALTRRIREVRPSLVLSVDHEGGRVQRFKRDFTVLPAMQALGRLEQNKGADLAGKHAREMAWLMATELLAHDIDLSYAPVLDLDDHYSEIIGDRAFCARADIASSLAEAFIDGMHDAGMATTGKHFPGHGGVKADSHLELPVDTRDLASLEAHDLIPFTQLHSKLDALMSAHIVFPSIDKDLVSFSKFWLQDYLRETLGYEGLVFSDDLTMEGAAGGGSFDERAQKALTAGCDTLLVCNHRQGAIEVLEGLELRNTESPQRSLSTLRKRESPTLHDLKSSKRYSNARAIIESF